MFELEDGLPPGFQTPRLGARINLGQDFVVGGFDALIIGFYRGKDLNLYSARESRLCASD